MVFTYYSELKVESQYSMGQSLFSRPWKFSSCPAILTAWYLIYVIFRNIKSKETRKGVQSTAMISCLSYPFPIFLKKSSSSLLVFSSSSGNPLIIKAQSISQIRVQFFPTTTPSVAKDNTTDSRALSHPKTYWEGHVS